MPDGEEDESMQGPLFRDGGRNTTPVPDPTRLTTDAVRSATEQWRRDLDGAIRQITTRLEAMDEATDLRLGMFNLVPARITEEVSHLEILLTERMKSIEESQARAEGQTGLQFKERDIRTDQAATASKQALDAALLAAKELVGQQNTANVEAAAKAEASFTKQIDQTGTLISTLEKALTDRITSLERSQTERVSELKERLDRGEGAGIGARDAVGQNREVFRDRIMGTNIAIAIGGFIIAVLSITFAIYAASHK